MRLWGKQPMPGSEPMKLGSPLCFLVLTRVVKRLKFLLKVLPFLLMVNPKKMAIELVELVGESSMMVTMMCCNS